MRSTHADGQDGGSGARRTRVCKGGDVFKVTELTQGVVCGFVVGLCSYGKNSN